jgi:hypothetical protein
VTGFTVACIWRWSLFGDIIAQSSRLTSPGSSIHPRWFECHTVFSVGGKAQSTNHYRHSIKTEFGIVGRDWNYMYIIHSARRINTILRICFAFKDSVSPTWGRLTNEPLYDNFSHTPSIEIPSSVSGEPGIQLY